MREPVITIRRIGVEEEPVVVIDDFAADPDALRAMARATAFEVAAHYYPGLRAALPPDYRHDQRAVVDAACAAAFGKGRLAPIDASFSMVTRSPAALTLAQRLPHCDAHRGDRIALVHYLSTDRSDGTAFFRHRATGFETVDEARLPTYRARLEGELRDGGRPSGYVATDTPLFERIGLVEARYNRAVLYRSFILHSGAIAPDAVLSPDPARGRLTVTAFFRLCSTRNPQGE